MTSRKVPTIIAAALLALTLAGCGGGLTDAAQATWPAITTATEPAPAPEPPPLYSVPEQHYLDQLDAGGVYYATPDSAIAVGYALCNYLEDTVPVSGNTKALLDATQLAVDEGYSETQAATIVAAGTAAFCPEYGLGLAGGGW